MTGSLRLRLMEHDWPGNVRELSHFAERVALGLGELESSDSVRPTNIEACPRRWSSTRPNSSAMRLSANHGDVRSTLETLGIPRKTFYDKLQRHGIDRADYAKQKPGD